MATKKNTQLATIENNTGYLAETVNLAELFSEELDGLRPSFEKIKIPAGGGLAYEVPGDDPASPDSAKEFSAVILYHHPINSYYKEKFTGGNNPPDCSSLDGKLGVVSETGECRDCKTCSYAKFGSGENGGMACNQDAAHGLARRVHQIRHAPRDQRHEGEPRGNEVHPEACSEQHRYQLQSGDLRGGSSSLPGGKEEHRGDD